MLWKMTAMHWATTPTYRPMEAGGANQYQPGVCNIGPEEIARRRRAGHVGAIMTLGLLAVLLLLHVSPWWRLLIAIPAAGTTVTYLQAILHFCVGFARLGVFNFGELGRMERVRDDAALHADRMKARRMIAAGCAIGLAVGVLAVLLQVGVSVPRTHRCRWRLTFPVGGSMGADVCS
jgi:hypothetical protein